MEAFVWGFQLDKLVQPSNGMQVCLRRPQARIAPICQAAKGQTGLTSSRPQVDSTDTSGAVLKINDVLLQAGSRDLLSFDEFKVMPRDRIGLVGPNGTGKTSLLRAISGEFPMARGRIALLPGKTIGYLPQQAVSGSERSVWDEASSQMHRLNAAEKDVREAELAVKEDPSTLNLTWLEKASVDFEAAGGFSKDEKIGNMLTGLGFSRGDWSRKCSELSGGWGMRVALARLLLSEPDLLLLDEPTNHLDVRTKAYLRSFLMQYPYSIVVVSHDALVLNDLTRIVDVRGGRLEFYTCNYSRFLQIRDQKDEQAVKIREKQDVQVEKLVGFITRFGAKATKGSAAQSKKKALEKLESKLVEAPAPTEGRRANLNIPAAAPSARKCVELTDATIGWPGGPALIENVSVVLERGERLAIVGKNGCGKSTLMRTLAGLLPLQSGKRVLGDERVSIGVFTQDLAADLPFEKSPFEYIEKLAPEKTVTEIRNVLGSLGLSGDSALREIQFLSGGEKARVALASFVICSYNVLMFDEPSNHLDMQTVEVLVEALATFDGAMVLVTHDRRLVEKIATRVLVVEEGGSTRLFETLNTKVIVSFAREAVIL
uniref:Probable ATP-dependent transporter ycf16 n=1 Tax=Rhodosorus marinus TaxID=101924 RepID=A0A7S3A8W5_9RHOD|mmetsp:Transcript_6652/g.28360  ORF Transcript_6652/g.28360 Transcript_6652/m.28360 type:complete len:600 (+) Transcript_6652:302-2101(+)